MGDTRVHLEDIVGKQNAFARPDYGESYTIGQNPKIKLCPDFLVKPMNTDQVQEIVKWANKTKTPLVPVSSASPHYGSDTKPSVPGAVIVDLSLMKRILKIDRRNRLVLIEPGVTWEELQTELKRNGLRIMAPLLPKKGKSVIASLLEREPCVSPKFQWNMSEPLRSLEIIWGTGDKIYSGSGVLRGEKEEDWEQGKIPVTSPGPNQFDFIKMVSAAQGSMGIVTWASVKCELYPDFEKVFFIQANRLKDLISFSYKILKFRFGDEIFILNRTAMAYILADDKNSIQSIKDSLSQWILFVSIKGGQLRAKEKVEFQEKDLKDIAQENGLKMVPVIGDFSEIQLTRKVLSYCGDNPWKTKYKDGAEEVFFLSTLDKTPMLLEKSAIVAQKHGYPFSDCGIYLQPLQQGVCVHCHIVIPVNRKNKKEEANVSALFNELSKELYKQGAFFSRPYGMWADMVYEGNAQYTIVSRKMKKIFDPENILNPGKLCF